MLVLSACGDDTPKEEKPKADVQNEEETKKDSPVVEEEPKEELVVEELEADVQEDPEGNIQAESNTYIAVEEVKELIEYIGIGPSDRLIDASVVNGEIKATIELAPHEYLTAADMATSLYSQASDVLLERDDWEVLTISFVGTGTVSMNRLEKESNENGDYFPTAIIEEILGIEY